MSGTKRQLALRKALRALVPGIPLDEAQAILERAGRAAMKTLPPTTALWLALTSHIRHRHTDYDTLLADGYDRDAARFFVAAATDDVLTSWGCARSVSEGGDEPEADAPDRARRTRSRRAPEP
jgi:hypothetical protein